MKRIAPFVLIAFAAIGLLGTPSTAFAQALPPCPGSEVARWHNCIGTYTWADGNKYVGKWQDGRRNGQGTLTYANGTKYVGKWKNGGRHGLGRAYATNDAVYKEGTWANNQLFRPHTVMNDGFGTFTYANGNKYVGEYREDLKNGVGTMVSPNGTVLHGGLWLNGEPVVKR